MEENIEEVNIKAYKCKQCGQVYINKTMAKLCHKKYYCENCGVETPRYMLLCAKCREKKLYEEATKMTYEEYTKKYPGCMIYYNNDYYADLEELLDSVEEVPSYVFGTERERLELDIESEINCVEDNSNLEDFSFENTKELIDYVNKWNEQNGQDVYYVNEKVIIVLNKENCK